MARRERPGSTRTPPGAMAPGNPATWFFLLCFALLVLAGHAPAGGAPAEDEEEAEPTARPMLRVSALPPHFDLSRRAVVEAWREAPDSIANLTTIEPVEGGEPESPTTVKVFADPDFVVVVARCYERDPSAIVSFSKARDSDLSEEDHVLVVFDTFQDDRSGYVFAVNPAGARFDGLVAARGEDVNSNWDAIWDAAAWRDQQGWFAVIRVPIKSLSFEADSRSWGFNVQRRVQRLQETSRWSGAKRDYEIYQTSHSGRLTELPEFNVGLGLSVRPSLVGRGGKLAPKDGTDYEGDLSLDAQQRLGPSLVSNLTINTDFAETEVDVRQINLTRFPLFFPEKRTFFLDGSDIFEFGLGLDEESIIPFFSRRIGLTGPDEDEQVAIPINVGGKVSGRLGNTSAGALVVNSERFHGLPLGGGGAPIDVPQTTMGAVRIKQDVLEESAVGMLAEFGDQSGRAASSTLGMDFTYQTSSFGDEKNLLAGIWGLVTNRRGLRGNNTAYGASVAYPNDLWDISLSSMHIGNGFDPSLGFVPRRDGHLWTLGIECNPRSPLPGVHQTFHEVAVSLFNDLHNDRWQTYTVTIKPLDWLLASGDRINASVELDGDRPETFFEVAPDVDIARGSYEWTRYAVGARSAVKRKISGDLTYEFGNFYNGELTTVEGSLRVKPSALFAVEISEERNTGRLFAPEDESIQKFERKFTERLLGVRLELNLSPDLQVSSLTQYDNESRTLGSNSKLRWTFDPHGDLFVVFNHSTMRRPHGGWQFVSQQVPVKLQYAWRF